MVRTRVGYAGGSTEDPTYYNLADHTETIQMDYDPSKITYEELLDTFWEAHNPTVPSYSRQYMSAIFYHDEEQKRVAEASKEREAEKRGEDIATLILPAPEFYLAEDYHQKYRLRGSPQFLNVYLAIYPDSEDFVNSTAVARMNGYIGANGTLDALEEEIDVLGLSAEERDRLWDIVAKYDKTSNAKRPANQAETEQACRAGDGSCG